MKKIILSVIILIGICSQSIAGSSANSGYLFPLKEPVKLKGQIVCSAWYSYKRADMNGQKYQALNYPCREGSEILAPEDGIVLDTGYAKYAGVFVKILIPKTGEVIEFDHLSNWSVVRNQKVTRGSVIGYTGRTGRTTGAHLRIVLYKNGNKSFAGASTWGMNYDDFVYIAGSSREELKFDFL